MSINPNPSASHLEVIRRPKEYCNALTEDKSRKEKGWKGSVEDEEDLQEAGPQVGGESRGASSLLSVNVQKADM